MSARTKVSDLSVASHHVWTISTEASFSVVYNERSHESIGLFGGFTPRVDHLLQGIRRTTTCGPSPPRHPSHRCQATQCSLFPPAMNKQSMSIDKNRLFFSVLQTDDVFGDWSQRCVFMATQNAYSAACIYYYYQLYINLSVL